jgi:hypothetical protein
MIPDMKRRVALPFLANSPSRRVPAVDSRRLAWVRIVFVTAWVAIYVALAVAALVSR